MIIGLFPDAAINYLVQPAPWMPAGHRYRLIKTQVDVSFDGCIVETDVGLAKPFKTEYFASRKAANERRRILVATSDETVLTVADFLYFDLEEMFDWLENNGQLDGINDPEDWFLALDPEAQGHLKIDFKIAEQKAIWARDQYHCGNCGRITEKDDRHHFYGHCRA